MGRPNGYGQPRRPKGVGALHPQFWRPRTTSANVLDLYKVRPCPPSELLTILLSFSHVRGLSCHLTNRCQSTERQITKYFNVVHYC